MNSRRNSYTQGFEAACKAAGVDPGRLVKSAISPKLFRNYVRGSLAKDPYGKMDWMTDALARAFNRKSVAAPELRGGARLQIRPRDERVVNNWGALSLPIKNPKTGEIVRYEMGVGTQPQARPRPGFPGGEPGADMHIYSLHHPEYSSVVDPIEKQVIEGLSPAAKNEMLERFRKNTEEYLARPAEYSLPRKLRKIVTRSMQEAGVPPPPMPTGFDRRWQAAADLFPDNVTFSTMPGHGHVRALYRASGWGNATPGSSRPSDLIYRPGAPDVPSERELADLIREGDMDTLNSLREVLWPPSHPVPRRIQDFADYEMAKKYTSIDRLSRDYPDLVKSEAAHQAAMREREARKAVRGQGFST